MRWWKRRFGGGQARNVEARAIKWRATLASWRRRAGHGGRAVVAMKVFGGGEERDSNCYSCTVGKPPFRSWSRGKTHKQQLYTTAVDDHTLSQRHARRRVTCTPRHAYWRGVQVPTRSPWWVPEDARSIKTFCNNPSHYYYYLLPHCSSKTNTAERLLIDMIADILLKSYSYKRTTSPMACNVTNPLIIIIGIIMYSYYVGTYLKRLTIYMYYYGSCLKVRHHHHWPSPHHNYTLLIYISSPIDSASSRKPQERFVFIHVTTTRNSKYRKFISLIPFNDVFFF